MQSKPLALDSAGGSAWSANTLPYGMAFQALSSAFNPEANMATANHIHNPTCACSCRVAFNGNAHRILYCEQHAAAPDLLEALQAMFNCASYYKYDFPPEPIGEWATGGYENEAWHKAKAAIAKATGQP